MADRADSPIREAADDDENGVDAEPEEPRSNKRRRIEPDVPDWLQIAEGEGRGRRASRSKVSYAEVTTTTRVGDILVSELQSSENGIDLVSAQSRMQTPSEFYFFSC